MAIPDEVRKCVFFIAYKLADGSVRFAGTAFNMARTIEGTSNYFNYVVTAAHVIDKIKNLGIDEVFIRANHKSGQAIWVKSRISDWWMHPDHPSVDVAILRLTPPHEWDHMTIPLDTVVTDNLIEKEKIGVGDEVFMTGLFSAHFGKQNNIPILRVGNIAAMPSEKINTKLGPMEGYLIECRSIGGLSGSPVFVNLGLVRHGKFSSTGNPIFYLLGLIHGHFDMNEAAIDVDEINPVADDGLSPKNINMGIAIVVPVSKILETLNLPSVKAVELPIEEKCRKNNSLKKS
jgi:hypothetical protein